MILKIKSKLFKRCLRFILIFISTIKKKSEYKYQVSSYFNLVKENPKITYKKKTFTRETRCQGYNFHEQIKIIEQNVWCRCCKISAIL